MTHHVFARYTNEVNYKKILVLCFKTFLRPRDDDRRHNARNTMQIKMQRNAKFQGKKNFGFLEYKCNELQKSSSSVSRRSSGLEWVILRLFANTKSQKSNSINCTGDQAMINRYKSLCRSINICINRDGAVLLPGVLNAEWLKYMTK